jgi:hypothetical protein
MTFIRESAMKWNFTIILAASLLAGTAGWAATAAPKPAGVAIFATGEVIAYDHGDSAKVRSLAAGATVFEGDKVKTGANGRAALAFLDGSQMKLNYNTEVQLKSKEVEGERNLRGINAVKLFIGGIWTKVAHNPKSTFEIETAAAVAAVKGCDGEVTADGSGSCFSNWHELKAFKVSNDQGSSSMKDGEQICVKKGEAPGDPVAYTGPAKGWYEEVKGGSGGQVLKVKFTGEGSEEEILIHLQ